MNLGEPKYSHKECTDKSIKDKEEQGIIFWQSDYPVVSKKSAKVDGEKGIAVMQNDLRETTTGHRTWEWVETKRIYSLAINKNGHIFAGTDDNIYLSTDNGNIWSVIDTILSGRQVYSILFSSAGQIFAGTDNGIYRSIKITNIIKEIPKELPSSFILKQNYPNPFNPSTIIKYSLNDNSFVKIIIYNSLGQVVERLMDQEQPAGVYTINWRPNNLPSRIYYYRMQTDKFYEMKKMMYVK